jgi:hypothetical protein
VFKTKIKLIISFISSVALVLASTYPAFAEENTELVEDITSPKIVINEVQLDGKSTSYEEFIELSLIGDTMADLKDWYLTVKNVDGSEICTGGLAFKVLLPELVITPGEPILIASQKNEQTKYFSELNPDIYYSPCKGNSSVLTDEEVISIFDAEDNLIDQVFIYPSGVNAPNDIFPIYYASSNKGDSFQRLLNLNSGFAQDTDNSTIDFEILETPTPGVLQSLPPADEEEDADDNTGGAGGVADQDNNDELQEAAQTVEQPQEPINYNPILLSELFIDPDKPLKDSIDEFVEIYNPNSFPVDISGYTIFTGSKLNYHYTFPEGTIFDANGYRSVTSGDSSLSLSNSGGAAKIVSPSGQVFDQTEYEKAKADTAWAKDDKGQWQWTSTVTKDKANVITALPVSIKKAASAVKKKSTTKKSTSVKSSAAGLEDEDLDLIDAPSPIPSWVLASLGAVALLYACYEYRFDISNKFHQLRLYREARR